MKDGDVARLKDVKWGDQNRLLKQLADLEALDYICGNVDRHTGNLMYQVENGRIVRRRLHLPHADVSVFERGV